MKTPYLVTKGAKVAREELNKALDAHSRLEEVSRACGDSGTEVVDIYREPLADLYESLHEVHEWLFAIEGEK